MEKKKFRKENISRQTPPHKNNYHDYKPMLIEDFNCRCGYCNLKNTNITTYFEIDHLIPRDAFKLDKPDLLTDYRNLVYSCKKCNFAKGKKFKGDINCDPPKNDLFYDPATVDYNNIFYRNEFGSIASDDTKGKQMIALLKLYRPIHILGWLCEEINTTADKLEIAIENEVNAEKKAKLHEALNSLNSQYRKLSNIFIATYNDDKFSIDGL